MDSSAYDGLCPEGDVVGVAFEQLTIGHAEKQAGLGVFYRVVVNIDAIGQDCHTPAIDYHRFSDTPRAALRSIVLPGAQPRASSSRRTYPAPLGRD